MMSWLKGMEDGLKSSANLVTGNLLFGKEKDESWLESMKGGVKDAANLVTGNQLYAQEEKETADPTAVSNGPTKGSLGFGSGPPPPEMGNPNRVGFSAGVNPYAQTAADLGFRDAQELQARALRGRNYG